MTENSSRNVWGFKRGQRCLVATAVAVLFMVFSEHIISPDSNTVGVVKKPENRSRSAQGSGPAEDDNAFKLTTPFDAEDDNAFKLTTPSDTEEFLATAPDSTVESVSTGLIATRKNLPSHLTIPKTAL